MSKVIYYFSGTGNNLATAKGLSELIPDMEVHPITELLKNKVMPDKYDLVGFIVPAYHSHIPPLVSECLRNLEFYENQKIFSIIGCAGMRGHASEDIRELINASGKTVNYEYMIMYPDNAILIHNAYPNWYQNFNIALTKKKIKKIANQLIKLGENKQLGKSPLYNSKSEDSLQKSISQFNQIGLEYNVNKDCIKCKSCIKICPANNISMENSQITFGANCQQCMACIQWCPKKAIDYKGVVEKRNRYHHPDITLKDMIEYNNG